MGVTLIDTATVLIENTLARSTRAALRELRLSALDVRDLSEQMAPVDEGSLGSALTVLEDSNGVNRRKRMIIYIDDNVVAKNGVKVGEYAERRHESNYRLGKKSAQKQRANPGVIVGRKFLERAADELTPDIIKAIQNAVTNAT